MTTIKVIRLASLVTAINVLVASGFSIDWELIGFPTIRNLQAVRWKLMNLEQLQIENPEKSRALLESLDAIFV